MKKIFAMFLAALMIVSLVACGDKKSTQNETSKETPSQFIAPEKDYEPKKGEKNIKKTWFIDVYII